MNPKILFHCFITQASLYYKEIFLILLPGINHLVTFSLAYGNLLLLHQGFTRTKLLMHTQ